jgi:autotransporter-associated beta strand protein
VQIVNPINLNARDRVFDVANGSDTEDAILSGVISGPGSGLVKRGLGTLVLDGVNTYSGSTDVVQGVLRLTKASLADASTVRIVTGGELNLSHGQTDIVGALYINGVAQADGIYDSTSFPGLLTGSGKLNVGGVPDGSSPYVQWVTANSIPDGKDEPTDDADSDGLLNLVEYAVGSSPVQATGSVLTKASSGAIQFNRAIGRTDITAFLESSPDLGTASWTTIATSTAGAAYVSNVPATITVAESSAGSGLMGVSVTDGTTPAPAKKFYRVRVTRP